MGGEASIRGQRVTVRAIVDLLGAGRTVDEILADYPYLVREDIEQAARYATRWWAGQKTPADMLPFLDNAADEPVQPGDELPPEAQP